MLKTILHYAQKYGVFALGAILLLTVAITCAEPIKDGDFFWQMEYGRYLWENNTLIPDHAMHSWTPADKNAVYCAWIAEILLYFMYELGGLPILFAFRYLCVLAFLIIIWTYARRVGQGKDVFTFFVLVVVLFVSHGATFLKPEIISMVFWALTAGLYFSVKSSLWGKWGTKPFLLYPILYLVWVNTHGVFVNGIIFFGCITIGEILNYVFCPRNALSKQGMRHLLAGSVLSLVVTLATPYGFNYHMSLYEFFLAPKEHPLITSVIAWRPLFQPGSANLYLKQFWIIMAALFAVLYVFFFSKRKSWDWAILLSNGFLAYMFTRYVRCAFYWPAFWAMSLIYLRSRTDLYWPKLPKFRMALKSGLLMLFLFLALRGMYYAKFEPSVAKWMGFGIGYFNSVQASAFLKEHLPGKRLYNSYNVGGYLIHDLYPTYKVFCDPRGFPYAEWYHEYLAFNHGQTPLEDFSKKYPFDVAVVDYYSSSSPILKFLKSRQWEPAFYGPCAMVFVRSDVDFRCDHRKLDKHRFDDIKTLSQANLAFFVAQNLVDQETSGYILQLIRDKFSNWPSFEKVVREASLYHEGLLAYTDGDYQKALHKLSSMGERQYTIYANIVLLNLRNWKAKQLTKEGQYQKALDLIEENLKSRPQYVDGLYNAGILAYYVDVREKEKANENDLMTLPDLPPALRANRTNWKNYLEGFLKLDPEHRHAWIAKQVLDGKGLPPNVTLAL